MQISGVPMAVHKREGPTTCLTYLGIEVDLAAGELRLPADKLQCPSETAKVVGRQEILLPQRSWSRWWATSIMHARWLGVDYPRMINLLSSTHCHSSTSKFILLNTDFHSDLAWWRQFICSWNGISFLFPPSYLPVFTMAADTSGSWGC